MSFAVFALSGIKWQSFAEGVLEREQFHEIIYVVIDFSRVLKDIFDSYAVAMVVTDNEGLTYSLYW